MILKIEKIAYPATKTVTNVIAVLIAFGCSS
jgi:hypothetical protein